MHRYASRTVGAFIIALLIAVPALAGSAALTPVKDNSLYENQQTFSNGAGESLFAGSTLASSPRRGLMQFDIAGGIPAGATITGASLTVTITLAPLGGPAADHSLHRLSADWGEGASDVGFSPGGLGAPAQPGDATWLERFVPGVPWGTPGGDFVAGASATTSAPAVTGATVTWNEPGMIADLQDWLDNPANNFGWAVIGDEAVPQSARRYASREHTDPAMRPTLTVEFDTGPQPVPTVGEWGLILMTLLFVASGTVLFGRARLAGAGGNAVMSWNPRTPFSSTVLLRSSAIVVGLAAAGLILGDASRVDVIGTLLCAPVLAYVVHLWWMLRRS